MSIATAITNLRGRIDNVWTAVEDKGGTIPASKTLANLATAVADLPSGDTDNEDGLIDNSLTIYENTRVTEVCEYCFHGRTNLRTVKLPNVTTINKGAFTQSQVVTVIAPKCTTIGASAFGTASMISTLDLSNSTMAQVKAMANFPWNIARATNCQIICSNGWVDRDGEEHPNT